MNDNGGERMMLDELAGFVDSLKVNEKVQSYDKAQAKQAVVLRILSLLGWNPFDVEEVRPGVLTKAGRFDYSLAVHGADMVFIEVKEGAALLVDHDEEHPWYALGEPPRIAILTSGVRWRFYLLLHDEESAQLRFASIDLISDDSLTAAERLVLFISKQNVESGRSYENARRAHDETQKEKLSWRTMFKAWNHIMVEPDEQLVELIGEATEGLCGSRPPRELIVRFLSENRVALAECPTTAEEEAAASGESDEPIGRGRRREDYKSVRIRAFVLFNRRYKVEFMIDMLLLLCKVLEDRHPVEFRKVLDLKGRSGSYFLMGSDDLQIPEMVGDSGVFVETLLPENEIVDLAYGMLELFGHSPQDLRIEVDAGNGRIIQRRDVPGSSDMTVEGLGLTRRTYNCLKEAGIDSVQQLLDKTAEDLLDLRSFGRGCLGDVVSRLASIGLYLKDG